ncbi:MAG: response regulator receiver protein [Bacteroidetes bacterium]|jgi:response regulator RpfG family c-di-GMP phosphodiesterase|nr:response regulator receiver protein [Bacteroidota bacterium]MDF2451884.1 response regulator receiver protein [Bacteroidota bacterium]
MKEPIKCLIIDDDPDDQEIFLMCIRKISSNIDCLTANSGVDAVGMLKSDKDYVPDYIFLDVNMPRMNGVDCLKKLKSIEKLNRTKILMYSTTSESDIIRETLSLGAVEFIQKPSRTGELKEKLSIIFNIVSKIGQH